MLFTGYSAWTIPLPMRWAALVARELDDPVDPIDAAVAMFA